MWLLDYSLAFAEKRNYSYMYYWLCINSSRFLDVRTRNLPSCPGCVCMTRAWDRLVGNSDSSLTHTMFLTSKFQVETFHLPNFRRWHKYPEDQRLQKRMNNSLTKMPQSQYWYVVIQWWCMGLEGLQVDGWSKNDLESILSGCPRPQKEALMASSWDPDLSSYCCQLLERQPCFSDHFLKMTLERFYWRYPQATKVRCLFRVNFHCIFWVVQYFTMVLFQSRVCRLSYTAL